MLSKIGKKVVEIADHVLAWGCLIVGASLLVIAVLGIMPPLILALLLLAVAAAHSRGDDRSVLVAASR